MIANLVRESISFERGKDPKEILGIGNNRKIQKGDIFLVNKYQSNKQIEVVADEDESYYEGNSYHLPYWEIMVRTKSGKLLYAFKYGKNQDWEIEEWFEF